MDFDVKKYRDAYEEACATVAAMHEAAMGCKTGPVFGVIEDVAALRDDAERYRWLRNKGWAEPSLYATGPRECGAHGIALLDGAQLDAAIDGAMPDGAAPCAG